MIVGQAFSLNNIQEIRGISELSSVGSNQQPFNSDEMV